MNKRIRASCKVKICKSCGGDFYVPKKKKKGRHNPAGVRRMGSITCSPKCSKDYRKNIYERSKNGRNKSKS